MLLRRGEICKNLYFIEKGFVRAYYDKDGQEVTSWFMQENDLIVSVHSFFRQQPSHENIMLLEKTTLTSISYEDLQALYRQFPRFNYTGRLLTENYYVLSEERLISMRMQSAQERYIALLRKYPQILRRAQLNQIASYLGMKPETLSRLRGNISSQQPPRPSPGLI
jgi:CRP-like cAMP-binding protein